MAFDRASCNALQLDGTVQSELSQTSPSTQSRATEQPWVSLQAFGHALPPQSTSVSSPSRRPFEQASSVEASGVLASGTADGVALGVEVSVGRAEASGPSTAPRSATSNERPQPTNVAAITRDLSAGFKRGALGFDIRSAPRA
jgi:hypothetical protein